MQWHKVESGIRPCPGGRACHLGTHRTSHLPGPENHRFFDSHRKNEQISAPIIKELIQRLIFLENVGLEYLSLSRSANTLSGGETQRIRLATQIGSRLTGVLYVLDEPSIGLHQRDNARLIKTLMDLKHLDNTVVVVEHDTERLSLPTM